MYVGYYRDLIFHVDVNHLPIPLMHTFEKLKRTMGADWTDHKSLGGRARMEQTGIKLQEMTFSMNLRADAGIRVREHLELLNRYLEDAKSGYFVLGCYPVTHLPWVITNLSMAYNMIQGWGGIRSATVDVTMKQYY